MSSIVEVPFLDLKAQYHSIKAEVDTAILQVLEGQVFILGPEVRALEEEIASYCKCKYAVGVSSGTDALLIALMVLGTGHGDEVVTSPYTFFATVGAIHRLGAKPVFVDIDPDTYNLNPKLLKKAVTDKTRAIIPVHLFGQCADMDPILEIAGESDIHVIEDAAQAIGAEYKNHRAGSMGIMGCLSFFPSKNLGGIGDGGMVTTNDAALADKLSSLRSHGSKPKYYHKIVGGNFRLDAINAAVLRVKLKYLDDWTNRRRKNAERYNHMLKEAGLVGSEISIPIERSSRHIYNQYVIRAQKRDALLEALRKAKIGAEVYYPVPMHIQECFADLGYAEGEFPVSEAAAKQTLAIPVYPELTEDQQNYVVDTISQFYRS